MLWFILATLGLRPGYLMFQAWPWGFRPPTVAAAEGQQVGAAGLHGGQVLQAGLQAGLELKAGLAGHSLGGVVFDEICHQLKV